MRTMGTIRRLADMDWDWPALCTPDTSLDEAARMVEERGVDGVVVVQGRGLPAGVISRESLRSPLLPPRARWRDRPAGPYASPSTVTFTPQTPVETALAILRRKRLPIGPVVVGGEIVGTVSQASLAAESLRRRLPREVRGDMCRAAA